MTWRFVLATCGLLLSSGAAFASFTVTTTADSGAGSLRQAIFDANANPGPDVIDFDVPSEDCSGAGVCSIVLASVLPEITDAVLIDGTTQPRHGAAPGNVCATRRASSYMRVQVEFRPVTSDYMLVVDSSGPSTVRGLSLLSRNVVSLRSAGAHHIACNHIGVDGPGGTGKLGGGTGVGVTSAGRGAIIGTNGDGSGDIGERNVFGETHHGVFINSNHDNWIAGNYFGFGADGVTPIGHVFAILIRQGSGGNLVGTDGDGRSDRIEHNLIGNCRFRGVLIDVVAGNSNDVIGNRIGVDADGEPAGNSVGIYLSQTGTDHLVQSNYIGSSTDSGIGVEAGATLAARSEDNCLVDNEIGFDHSGTEDVVFENNWWGSPDGPSGLGSGSGDSVIEGNTGVVNYDPWLPYRPESCFLLPEPSQHLLGAGAVGVLASLRKRSRRRFDADSLRRQ